MTRGKSIEKFGLQRSEKGHSRSVDSFEFLVLLKVPTREENGISRQLLNPELKGQLGQLHKYAFPFFFEKAYVVFEVFPENDEGARLTYMRI